MRRNPGRVRPDAASQLQEGVLISLAATLDDVLLGDDLTHDYLPAARTIGVGKVPYLGHHDRWLGDLGRVRLLHDVGAVADAWRLHDVEWRSVCDDLLVSGSLTKAEA